MDRNSFGLSCLNPVSVALRKESVDRNITALAVLLMYSWSLSARRAWIEICYLDKLEITEAVALRKESVDRNPLTCTIKLMPLTVALRKESVDRNLQKLADAIKPSVALRKESVDRNISRHSINSMTHVALRKESVDRNLWWGVRKAVGSLVALRKESVDRNNRPDSQKHINGRRSPQGERG